MGKTEAPGMDRPAEHEKLRKGSTATAQPPRPPSWRSRRAHALAEGGLRAGRGDDEWVRRARRITLALSRHGESGGGAVDPRVAGAYRLDRGDRRLRTELEARLLAGQDDSEIALCMGLDPGAVAAYGALFFAVRDRIGATDWVAAQVFGARLYDGRGVGDDDLATKLIAYTFGPIALDALLGRPVAGVDVARVAEALRRYVLAATAPVTARDAPRWLAVTARMDEIEREEAASRLATVSGPIRVRDDILATFSTAGSTVDTAVHLPVLVIDVVNGDGDDDPAVNIPEGVAEGLGDFLDRRTA